MSWRRLWALVQKELWQIGRNRQLILFLIVPPTIQIVIFGFALDPTVHGLRLAVVDDCHDAHSRELVSTFVRNGTFTLTVSVPRVADAQSAMDRNEIDAALIVPADFSRRLLAGHSPRVQLFFNAMNANTAGIARAYAARTVEAYNRSSGRAEVSAGPPRVGQAVLHVTFLYNPGLLSSWFVVCGTLGLLLVLNGSLVASNTTLREKDVGTLEQLMMTPAQDGEIVFAKIAPLFVLLSLDVLLGLGVAQLAFGVPVRGSFLLFWIAGAVCVTVGIGIGTLIGTFARTSLQAQLMTFFLNPPLALLSGSFTPVEAMPEWVQPLTLLNPIRHFGTIAREVLIKGAGVGDILPNFLALMAFTVVLLGISVWRFRKQLD